MPTQGLAQRRGTGAAGDLSQGHQPLARPRMRSVKTQLGEGLYRQRPAGQFRSHHGGQIRLYARPVHFCSRPRQPRDRASELGCFLLPLQTSGLGWGVV